MCVCVRVRVLGMELAGAMQQGGNDHTCDPTRDRKAIPDCTLHFARGWLAHSSDNNHLSLSPPLSFSLAHTHTHTRERESFKRQSNASINFFPFRTKLFKRFR